MAETRTQRDRRFAALVESAEAAGRAAAEAATPTPMIVYEPGDVMASLLGQDDGGLANAKRVYEPVMDGVCGFAWVSIKPGTSAFARWLRKTGKARTDAYYGGVSIWISDYRQSMTLKEAYATAYAAVLREAGFKAYCQSRMD